MGSDNKGELMHETGDPQYATCKVVMENNSKAISDVAEFISKLSDNLVNIEKEQIKMNTQLIEIEKKLDKHNNFRDRLAKLEGKQEKDDMILNKPSESPKEDKPKGLKKWQIIVGMIVLGVGLFGGISGIVQFFKDIVNALLKVSPGG